MMEKHLAEIDRSCNDRPEIIETAMIKKYNLGLDIDFHLLTPEIVARVHALGQEVNVWTVNTKEDGERMVSYGVDYITSNILE